MSFLKREGKQGEITQGTKSEIIREIAEQLREADAIVLGAGAGLSTAAGFTYGGSRFQKHFAEFIEQYGMTDMYSAGFYPFRTQEEKWAYWSRQIYCNRYDVPAGQPYRELYEMVKDRNYFVITTNVDHQFQAAGFPEETVFATQGDYGLFQCARACHNALYDNEAQVREMVEQQKNCRIPEELVPKCPVCGGDMEVNLRCDSYFVEDEAWHRAAERYEAFLRENLGKRIVFMELGVGMNTPGIIKYPFWQMTKREKKAVYICINKGEAWAPEEIQRRSICLDMDLAEAIKAVAEEREGASRQEERLDFLIGELQKENKRLESLQIPRDKKEKRDLLRSMVNIRMPDPIGRRFLKVQDEFLQQEAMEKGITKASEIPAISQEYGCRGSLAERISLWQGDITTLEADAIVNAANSRLLGCFVPCHKCIDNAIHTAAGVQLREACSRIMEQQGCEEPTGTAKLTEGYNLPCSYVIHTVGPIVGGRLWQEDCRLLESCYQSCLSLAAEKGLKSLAFCCISTGEFHFPQEKAAEIALDTAVRFLKGDTGLEKIIFNVFKNEDLAIYQGLIKRYNREDRFSLDE